MACVYVWDSAIYTYASNMPKKTVLEPGPYPMLSNAKDSAINTKPSSLFAVGKNTKYPKESSMLIGFLLSDPEGIRRWHYKTACQQTRKRLRCWNRVG
ncbi:MAG: hypothetical protein ACR5LF_08020 [Symbiopectobacterium sp.]